MRRVGRRRGFAGIYIGVWKRKEMLVKIWYSGFGILILYPRGNR